MKIWRWVLSETDLMIMFVAGFRGGLPQLTCKHNIA